MADITDEAQELDQRWTQAAVKHYRKETGPVVRGFCLCCGVKLEGDRRWCDAECRDAWEADNGAR